MVALLLFIRNRMQSFNAAYVLFELEFYCTRNNDFVGLPWRIESVAFSTAFKYCPFPVPSLLSLYCDS